jgi:hypothetical protein
MTQNLLDETADTAVDPNKDYLVELVGENKKFSDVQSLARGKYESDKYIETLTRQLDSIREDYKRAREENIARARLEEIADRISNQSQQLPSSVTTPTTPEVPKFDPKQIEDLVEAQLSKKELVRKQEQNFNAAMAKIKERYGDNYRGILSKQIDDLGLDVNFVNDLAKNHPNVLFKTLGLDAPRQQDNLLQPPRSNTRSDNFTPSVTKRTWSYYQKMRKEQPDNYYNPKTQVQMHNDAISLGNEFEDGDYNAI